MIKLTAAAGIVTLMAGCVVAPDAGYGYGYGYGPAYYPDTGYLYGPAYGPAYGVIDIEGGGGRDFGRHHEFHHGGRDGHHGGDRGGHGHDRGNDWSPGGFGRGDGGRGSRH